MQSSVQFVTNTVVGPAWNDELLWELASGVGEGRWMGVNI